MSTTAEIQIWPGTAPGSETWTHHVVEDRNVETGGPRVRNVVVPTLTPILPEPAVANGTAMIVAPGGGFQMLEWGAEGTDPATWLAERGIACFVLRYRLDDTGETSDDFARAIEAWMARRLLDGGAPRQVTDPHDVAPETYPLAAADGAQAVRLVRSRAAEWSVDPRRIGFLGFSAGAFVATAVATQDDLAARPDFVAPIYGGSVDTAVPADAPPMFALVAADDPITFDITMQTFRAWCDAGRSAELHAYAEGGHGFGTRKQGLPVDGWMDRLAEWMGNRGFLP